MATMALSPSCMYSKAAAETGSTHPVPVTVAITRLRRENAPVRSSSATARSASAAAASSTPSSTDLMPTYTRIGSSTVASAPANPRRSSTVGPPPAKFRPSYPRVSQPTNEPGPPDRSNEVGAVIPGGVPSSTVP
ncbi:unannotated protein [freshwater metagenome]|uniref:Unannotated protein n=1 Tax=freshwater metagenome TaxID=449393 RepID=A0A6J5YFZ9_9ZZZZ